MKKKMKIKKNEIKLRRDIWMTDYKAQIRLNFTPKQIKKNCKKLGMSVDSVDIVINPNKKKVKVLRMYRNGKRIHRKNPFKAKMV